MNSQPYNQSPEFSRKHDTNNALIDPKYLDSSHCSPEPPQSISKVGHTPNSLHCIIHALSTDQPVNYQPFNSKGSMFKITSLHRPRASVITKRHRFMLFLYK